MSAQTTVYTIYYKIVLCEMTLRPRGHSFNLPRFKYDLTRKSFVFSLYDYRWIRIIISVVALCFYVVTLRLTKLNKLLLTYLLTYLLNFINYI